MKIYFAGSIRGGRDDQVLYLGIINLLKNYGDVLTEHIGKKTLSVLGEQGLTDEQIYNRDITWLKQADAVVADVTTPSSGVGYEIGKAEEEKPVLCLFREGGQTRLSGMISGNKNIRVEKYKNLSDVGKILEEFFRKNSSPLR